jgi:hypothetical protein
MGNLPNRPTDPPRKRDSPVCMQRRKLPASPPRERLPARKAAPRPVLPPNRAPFLHYRAIAGSLQWRAHHDNSHACPHSIMPCEAAMETSGHTSAKAGVIDERSGIYSTGTCVGVRNLRKGKVHTMAVRRAFLAVRAVLLLLCGTAAPTFARGAKRCPRDVGQSAARAGPAGSLRAGGRGSDLQCASCGCLRTCHY